MAVQLSVEIHDGEALDALAAPRPRLRAALLSIGQALEAELVAKARARAPVRTGAYRDSIGGDVAVTPRGVVATVWAEAFYANILERGAVLPAREILPDVAEAMHFLQGGKEAFAKSVYWPGGEIAPRHILGGALEDMKSEIAARLAAAIESALNL